MTGFLLALLFLSTLNVARNAESQRAPAPPAVPIEPIGAIVEAFRSCSIVALGEGLHGNEQGHAFRLALIRDPRFATIVNDIVVECGNAKYQDVMDRFVRGDEVPYEALRQVWQNTTQISGVWDRPIYEEFFRAVRGVNASLPRERQLRVLLGDPPVDWGKPRGGSRDGARREAAHLSRCGSLSRTSVCDYVLPAISRALLRCSIRGDAIGAHAANGYRGRRIAGSRGTKA